MVQENQCFETTANLKARPEADQFLQAGRLAPGGCGGVRSPAFNDPGIIGNQDLINDLLVSLGIFFAGPVGIVYEYSGWNIDSS